MQELIDKVQEHSDAKMLRIMKFNSFGEGREMQKLIELMKAAMLLEYDRVRKKYGDTYNTPHEAYAVTLEEFEEAQKEIELIAAQMRGLWSLVKADCDIADQIEGIKEHALLGAAECVQIAMCCHKALQSECCKESEDVNEYQSKSTPYTRRA